MKKLLVTALLGAALALACWALEVAPLRAAPMNFTTSAVSVLITSTQVLAAGSNLQQVTFQNTDATNPVYLSTNCPATTSGMKLSAGSAVWFSSAPRGAVCAIATGGTVNVAVVGGAL